MTESVIEILPNGGYSGWDRMGLGYDGSPAILFPVSLGTDAIFSLQDAAVAGVIDKITVAYRLTCSEAFGRTAQIQCKMLTHGSWYTTAAVVRAENDPTWYYVDVAVNPNTSAAWTWAEIDALNAGIRVNVPYAGWCGLLQFKVQVTYTPAAYVPPMTVRGCPMIGPGGML